MSVADLVDGDAVEVEFQGPNFVMIPEWVLDADIDPRAVVLYGVLARYGRDKSFAKRGTIAERMRCSVDTVDRARKHLERIGALKVTRRKHPDNPKLYISSVYSLRFSPPDDAGGGRTDAARVAAPLRQKEREQGKESKELPLSAPPTADAGEGLFARESPSDTRANEPSPPLPPKAVKPPARNPQARAFVDAMGWQEPLPRTAAVKLNQAVKRLREQIGEHDPARIADAVAAYRRQWPSWACSPQAVVSHWHELRLPRPMTTAPMPPEPWLERTNGHATRA